MAIALRLLISSTVKSSVQLLIRPTNDLSVLYYTARDFSIMDTCIGKSASEMSSEARAALGMVPFPSYLVLPLLPFSAAMPH